MNDNSKRVYIGGDQKGHALRVEIMEFLKSKGYACVELGLFDGDDTPYNTIEDEVKEKVNIDEPGSFGLLLFSQQEKQSPDLGEDKKAS